MSDQAQRLPFCDYPGAADVAQHGMQPLPDTIPLVDYEKAQPYRSHQYQPVLANTLNSAQLLQMARVIADSFALRDPLVRDVNPPKNPPPELERATHSDAFGIETFGVWTSANLYYWHIRLFLLTDPSHLTRCHSR